MTGASATERKTASAKRVLIFTLGKERYAVGVMSVRGIIQPMDISPVPRAPAEFLGVINLRGKIIPVIDLRIKFGLEFTGRTNRTLIVVVETGPGGARRQTGLVVDEVQEVMTLNDVEEAPSFGTAMDVTYIRGLAKTKDGVMILLDLEKLLNEAKPESAQ